MMGFLFSLLLALTLLRESQGLTIAECGDSYRRPGMPVPILRHKSNDLKIIHDT